MLWLRIKPDEALRARIEDIFMVDGFKLVGSIRRDACQTSLCSVARSNMSAAETANGHSQTPNGDSAHDSGVNGTSNADISSSHACELEGCDAPAKQKCPTCLELKLPESFFCTQEHFKLAWKSHKAKHAVKPQSSCPTKDASIPNTRAGS
jgi:hypothetical protein